MIRKKKSFQEPKERREVDPAAFPPSQRITQSRMQVRILPLVGLALILLFALLLHFLTPPRPLGTENTASVVQPEIVPISENTSPPQLP